MKKVITYILTSILTVTVIPALFWMIPLINFLMLYVVLLPVKLFTSLAGFPELINFTPGYRIANGNSGYISILVTWLILGTLIGMFIFRLRQLSFSKHGLEVPDPGFGVIGMTMMCQILIAIISVVVVNIMGL